MTDEVKAAIPEPAPTKNEHPCTADMAAGYIAENWGTSGRKVVADIMARKEFGLKKYGTPLQPFNGRNTLNDLYQELVDGIKYATSAIFESKLGDSATFNSLASLRLDLVKAAIKIRDLMDKQSPTT